MSSFVGPLVALLILALVAILLWRERQERRRRRRTVDHAGAHDPASPAAPPGDGFTPTNNQWG
jgi:ABC-type Fe3+ transport system permease subunit